MAQPCSHEIVVGVVAAQQLERQPTNLEVVGLNAKLFSSCFLLYFSTSLQNNLSYNWFLKETHLNLQCKMLKNLTLAVLPW